MPRYDHPLQLFSLEYPEGMELQYQEETAGILLASTSGTDAYALSILPLALPPSAKEPDPVWLVTEAAKRLGIRIPPAKVKLEKGEDRRIAMAEGDRPGNVDDGAGSRFRFWAISRGPLALNVVQLGPGAVDPVRRAEADRVVASVTYPEVLPISPAEFQIRVLEILAREYPGVAAKPRGPWRLELTSRPGEPPLSLGLENIYRSCLLQSESTGALIRDFLDEALEAATAAEADETRTTYEAARPHLLPVIKSREWVEQASGALELATVPFAPDLVLCFAIDEPTRLVFLTRELLEQWDVPLERIQGIAQDNLAARTREVEFATAQDEEGRPTMLVLNTGDGYDAARFALPGLRDVLAADLGEEYLVGLPNRDCLVAYSTRDPEMVARITAQVRRDYHRMDHPITPTIYRVRADTIEPVEAS